MSSYNPTRRLLILLPLVPRLDATNGTGRATAQLLFELSGRHRVAVAYLRFTNEPSIDNILRERCDVVEEVVLPGHGSSVMRRAFHGVRLVGSMLQGRPMWVTDWVANAFHAKIRLLAHNWQPDIIQLEYHIMGQYLSALNTCPAPRVLVEHDPGVQAAPYLRHTHNRLGQLLHYLDKLAWRRFERNILRQVQAVIVFTDRDRQVLAPLAGETPVVQIPIGTVSQNDALNPLGVSPPSLAYVGNFKHAPNIDAAERLIQTILPQVRRYCPETMLYIIGDQPPPRLKQMAGDHVIVTGRVPDVMPYLDQAALVVVPLRLGGGMRVKVLEALAAGKAVVASPLALEGLNVVDGEQVVVASSDEQFSEKINQLLANPARRQSLATKAYRWAGDNLGWNKSVQAYEALYQQLIEQPYTKGVRQ